jgi:hypothetical protein
MSEKVIYRERSQEMNKVYIVCNPSDDDETMVEILRVFSTEQLAREFTHQGKLYTITEFSLDNSMTEKVQEIHICRYDCTRGVVVETFSYYDLVPLDYEASRIVNPRLVEGRSIKSPESSYNLALQAKEKWNRIQKRNK